LTDIGANPQKEGIMFNVYRIVLKSRNYFYAGLPSGELFDKEDENRADLELTEETEVGSRIFRQDENG